MGMVNGEREREGERERKIERSVPDKERERSEQDETT